MGAASGGDVVNGGNEAAIDSPPEIRARLERIALTVHGRSQRGFLPGELADGGPKTDGQLLRELLARLPAQPASGDLAAPEASGRKAEFRRRSEAQRRALEALVDDFHAWDWPSPPEAKRELIEQAEVALGRKPGGGRKS